MEASITLKKVGKRYKNNSIITDLSLGIEKGTTFTIIGQDGAGKSTLIKILAGLIKTDSGKVYIHGQDINQFMQETRQQIGYLPPHNIHDPWLTGRENIERYKNFSSHNAYNFKKLYHKFTDLLEFDNYMDQIAAHYPKGVKRRLDLILVLLQDPAILLLDEPIQDLDYHTKQIMLDYLNNIKKEKTTVIATDDFTEIETVTDRWVVLHNGSIRYDGDLEKMVSHVNLDFTGFLEIKNNFRKNILESLKSDDLVKKFKNLGNTIEIKTDSASDFFTLIEKLGEDKFCRIAGNSVDLNYLLEQLTSDEGY